MSCNTWTSVAVFAKAVRDLAGGCAYGLLLFAGFVSIVSNVIWATRLFVAMWHQRTQNNVSKSS